MLVHVAGVVLMTTCCAALQSPDWADCALVFSIPITAGLVINALYYRRPWSGPHYIAIIGAEGFNLISLVCVRLHLRDGRTNERTDAGNRIWCILVLKCDVCDGSNFIDFPDNQLTKFRVFFGFITCCSIKQFLFFKHSHKRRYNCSQNSHKDS